MRERCAAILREEEILREGGGKVGQERQRKRGRLPARERVAKLLDRQADFFEIGLWAAYKMYEQWGSVPAAGAVAGIGNVAGIPCMIIANDATVKAGAFFPQTAKKLIRAQRIAFENALPIIYLVDSSGVFLPMQDEIFPDEDDFGRIFRNNSVISAAGIPQFAAIMGNCVAGGAYLPVLCDKVLMTEGSGLYLAGPSLVKAAIGQIVETEELGGAHMHAEISGTVDFYEKDDPSCLKRLRSLVAHLPEAEATKKNGATKKVVRPRKNRKRFTISSASKAKNSTTRATCSLRSSMAIRLMNTKPITAKRLSRLTRASADIPSASWPISGIRCARRKPASRWAASFTPTAPIKPRASSWIATRPVCRSSFSRTSPASWWAGTPNKAASFAAARSS